MLTSPNFQLVRSRLRRSPVLTGRRANITFGDKVKVEGHIRQGTFDTGAGWNHALSHTRRHCRCYLVETDCLHNAKCLRTNASNFMRARFITEPRCSCIIGTPD